MHIPNMNHFDKILGSVYRPEKLFDVTQSIDPIILRSWKRCVTHYNLEPSETRRSRILTQQELLDYKTPVEDFINIAKSGLRELHKQVNALNYVVLLTDKNGITVEYIGNDNFDAELRSAGLYLGSDWNEMHSGTSGVGICATEMKPVTVHQADHFDLKNTTLTCSAAPIFDPKGQPLAVLDVSSLTSPQNKQSQYLLLQLVKLHSQIIESANFLHHYSKDNWILRFGSLQEYVNVNAANMIAIDETGEIIGINSSARNFFNKASSWNDENWDYAVGKNIAQFFDCELDNIINSNTGTETCIKPAKLRDSGKRLYFTSSAPLNSKFTLSRKTNNSTRPSLEKVSYSTNFSLAQLAGSDPAMQKSIKLAKRLLNSNINFLIQGETGSGKEVFAKAIHNESQRKDGPFIAVNCAAIPESLIESELFGYKPGSFTGAKSKGMRGLIEQSSGGTLFLDEIGDMPLQLQTRLLRVLSEQEVMPLGSDKPISVDLNVISASHKHIETMIREGAFREDLYFRLAGATLCLYSLRERNDMEFIIKNIMIMESGNQNIAIEPDVLQLLSQYHWPGNVRELKNTLRIAFAFSDHGKITRADLPEEFMQKLIHAHQTKTALSDPVIADPDSGDFKFNSKIERLVISLKKNKWNITDTAQELGISRATIYRKMKKYKIIQPNNLEY